MVKDEKNLIKLNTIKGYEDVRDCYFFNTETLEFLGGRWERRLDKSNLCGLCRSCHNKKSAEEKQKRE